MRYLVISDIHANLTAFDAVLADAEGDYDKVWCLGDVVGYGPHPNECIERLRQLDHLCIAGNHDWAVIDKLDCEEFQPHARFAVLWTRDQLRAENYDFLNNLIVSIQQEEVFTLVHGSPRHPIWEYVTSVKLAQLNFGHFQTPYCMVGHTHSPVVFVESEEASKLCEEVTPSEDIHTQQLNSRRLIINPGSVGQPRDGDPRASYGLLDTDAMQFRIKRVPYQIGKTQHVMKDNDFPERLWMRLSFGY